MNLFGRSFVGYLWVWAEDVLFGEARRMFLKLENSFGVVWEVWRRLSVTAFYSARLFEEEWLSCQTCVVWLKSELWKKAATPLSCFHRHGCVTPGFDLRHLDVHDIQMQSALVVDAKALYDSLKAEVPQMQGDRRSKIEVMVVKQTPVNTTFITWHFQLITWYYLFSRIEMDEMKTKLKWISSETQLVDGVTKIAARQLLADRLRSLVFSLHSDQSFQAAKKKTLAERQDSAWRNAIGRLQKGIGFAVLTNQLEPVRGDDFAEDSFSSYNIIFIFTFLTMFVATVFWHGSV